MRHGLIRELARAASAATRRKAEDGAVPDQLVDGGSSVPDLSMCDLHNAQTQRYVFRTESDIRIGC